VKPDAAGAAAEVEDSPANEPHGTPLLRPPRPERSEEVVGLPREDAAVITLDDLNHALTCEEIAQQVAECVLLQRERRTKHSA
jgi:hypothetical protein